MSSLIVAWMVTLPASAKVPRDGAKCEIDGSAGAFNGAQGIVAHGKCVPFSTTGDTGDPAPPTRTVNCGKTLVGALGWNPSCGKPQSCFTISKRTGKRIQTPAFGTETKSHGVWSTPTVWCPADPQPAITLAAISDQALRLLPKVAIGSTWAATPLVNVETVLWAGTTADRVLGTVHILGQPVSLRAHLDHATWTFGDNTTATSTTPGKTYNEATDPCRTAQCADYFGHTYRNTGTMTITLAVTWHAQYRIGNGAWTDLAAAITGPTERHTFHVHQAVGVLVANP